MTPQEPPADLRDAVRAYEDALAADDLDALADAFADDPGVLRADARGLLVGPDEIAAFRTARGGVRPRVLAHVEHRRITDDTWLVVGVAAFADGGRGVQTQVWVRTPPGPRWRIAAAHVTGRSASVDRSVWRVVGDPLVGPGDGDLGTDQGTGDGPLRGLAVAVKDVVAVAGQRIGGGNPARLRAAPVETEHAWAVANLLCGGAAVRGIATTDELAYSISGVNVHHGTPPNVRDPRAIPGGSSSGVGAAVALGQADVGLATDTAGSVRVPASYQGLWGLRTTHGLVPRDGVLPLAPTFDTVGWLTRDGAVLERVVAWAAGALGAVDRRHAPARLLVPSAVAAAVEPPVRAPFQDWVRASAERLGVGTGVVVVGELAALQEAFRVVQAAEAWRAHGEFFAAHAESFGTDVAQRFRAAERVTPGEERAARVAVARERRRLRDVVGDDLLVLPTAPGPPPPQGDAARVDAVRAGTLRLTTLAGVAGLPALSVPALDLGDGRRGRPVGVTLVGPAGTDLALVRHARRLHP